ncbi:hypothetical protein AA102526_1235 [Asaia lannensis NBRC 102526]|nr:hypothetical protein AA102526_1235 [Asaia lannensis NBRC 102526]
MKGAENEARAIDENEMGLGAHAATLGNENFKLRISYFGRPAMDRPGGAYMRPYWPARPRDAILPQ